MSPPGSGSCRCAAAQPHRLSEGLTDPHRGFGHLRRRALGQSNCDMMSHVTASEFYYRRRKRPRRQPGASRSSPFAIPGAVSKRPAARFCRCRRTTLPHISHIAHRDRVHDSKRPPTPRDRGVYCAVRLRLSREESPARRGDIGRNTEAVRVRSPVRRCFIIKRRYCPLWGSKMGRPSAHGKPGCACPPGAQERCAHRQNCQWGRLKPSTAYAVRSRNCLCHRKHFILLVGGDGLEPPTPSV